MTEAMPDMLISSSPLLPTGENLLDVSPAFVVNMLFRCGEFLAYVSSTSSPFVKSELRSMDDVLDVEIERWLSLALQDSRITNENFYELASSVKFDESKSSTYWTSATEFKRWWKTDAMVTYNASTSDDSHSRSSVVASVDIVKKLIESIVHSFESSSLVLGPLDGINQKFLPSYLMQSETPVTLAMLQPLDDKKADSAKDMDSSKLLTNATVNTTAESSLETKYSVENESSTLSRMFSGWTELTRWSSYSSTLSSDSVSSLAVTFNPIPQQHQAEDDVGNTVTVQTSTDSITADSNTITNDDNGEDESALEDSINSIDDEMSSLIV